MQLNVKALSLTFGLVWGVGLFLGTWWIMAFEGPTGKPTIIGMVYRGYAISPLGSVIGLIWGLVDGMIGGALIAWVYNRIVTRGTDQPAPSEQAA